MAVETTTAVALTGMDLPTGDVFMVKRPFDPPNSLARALTLRVLLFVSFWTALACVIPASSIGAQAVSTAAPNEDRLGNVETTSLSFGVRHSLPSEALGETRTVDVHLPAGYDHTAPSHRYPVVVVLDGEFLFQTTTGVVDHLASVGRMPEAIVVGIPNNTGDRLSMSPKYLGDDGQPNRTGGKEEAYLRFFQHELLPFLARHYRAAPFNTVIGLSPTAGFVLHSFWKAPKLFQAHIALVLGKKLSQRYDAEMKVSDALVAAVEADPGRRAYLYLASAASNYDVDPSIGAQFETLGRRLAQAGGSESVKGLRFEAERVEGSAYAVALPALLSAFELIFPTVEWERNYSDFAEGEALANLDAHFDALSSRYGFPVVPLGDRFFNRNCLRGLAASLRRSDRTEESIAILRRWVDLYPGEARAYFHLAYALKSAGQPAEAYKEALEGLSIARSNSDPQLDSFETYFEDFDPGKAGK